MLIKAGYEVIPIGVHDGAIEKLSIVHGMPEVGEIDSVSIFLGKDKQKEYESYLLEMNPKRIIINPGAENLNFERKAKRKGIEVKRACTIEMISARRF